MYKLFAAIVILMCVEVRTSGIFHENTKITFHPDVDSGFFGYSVFVYEYGIMVSAPKARSKVKPTVFSGLVYNCSINIVDDVSDVMCYPMDSDSVSDRSRSYYRYKFLIDFFRDDMWYGASMGALSNNKILICAPRYAELFKDNHILPYGACYMHKKGREMPVYPLADKGHLAYMIDGKRKEYGDYGTHLNFYANGQVGMSMKVTESNTVIIGAPGLLHWTGGIVNYKFNPADDSIYFAKQTTTNPYFTKELGPDHYFGYSVESGIFEKFGQVLYVGGAPRSNGTGQVLIFEPAVKENAPLKIQGVLKGPQLGAYFGASLCCTDIDGDGRSDLLVGAPNYVQNDGGLPYDQGAVFVYMASDLSVKEKVKGPNFILEPVGYVIGSGQSGARFGTAIAGLGDIDGDGYKDIAIGAPWEDDGVGAVYIYRGTTRGLKSQYVQRIAGDHAQGFGWSIAKGFDVDHNNCSDLVVGAFKSNTVSLYRCVPTIQVHASIKVPDAMNLPQNSTSFTAMFCLTVPAKHMWSHVKLDLKARIVIDPEQNRARVSGDSEYNITVKPGNDICGEQTVEVTPTADLSRPISIKFELEPLELLQDNSSTFLNEAARLSEDSELQSSFLIQLVRDCGDDLICTPWLVMTWDALVNPYIPGSEKPLGGRLTVLNKEEPAYGAKVYITLPATPIRVPSECSLKELNMTCNIPAPLERGDEITWDIELEYTARMPYEDNLRLVAVLEDSLYSRNITDEPVKELVIDIVPQANFTVSGKPLPNGTITVTRPMLYETENITFSHHYETINYGPSDWYRLEGDIFIPEHINLSSPIKGCSWNWSSECGWSIPAKVSVPIVLALRFDLAQYVSGDMKENTTFNVTTKLSFWIKDQFYASEVTATLILEPGPPTLWYLIAALIVGLLLLALIILILYKLGFFSRTQRDKLKELQEQTAQQDQAETSCSSSELLDINDSTRELLIEDSE
uniref:Hemocyte-specific integrin alpha subunit 3 n=1 Tax=Manduca sexta TaxID=7130 RepID=Q1G0S5_MANSE|nr:hemocyte-specific integrin alpha subunit 3 [Manduca sexta]